MKSRPYRGMILEVWTHRCQPVKTGEQNKLLTARSLPVLFLRFFRGEFDLFKHQVIHALGGIKTADAI